MKTSIRITTLSLSVGAAVRRWSVDFTTSITSLSAGCLKSLNSSIRVLPVDSLAADVMVAEGGVSSDGGASVSSVSGGGFSGEAKVFWNLISIAVGVDLGRSAGNCWR